MDQRRTEEQLNASLPPGEAPTAMPPSHKQEDTDFDRAFSELMRKRSQRTTATRISWPRVMSLLLATAYLVSSRVRFDAAAVLRMAMFCMLPLACIWFPDVAATYVGGSVDRESPRGLLVFFAWVVLLIPLFRGVLWYVYGATGFVL